MYQNRLSIQLVFSYYPIPVWSICGQPYIVGYCKIPYVLWIYSTNQQIIWKMCSGSAETPGDVCEHGRGRLGFIGESWWEMGFFMAESSVTFCEPCSWMADFRKAKTDWSFGQEWPVGDWSFFSIQIGGNERWALSANRSNLMDLLVRNQVSRQRPAAKFSWAMNKSKHKRFCACHPWTRGHAGLLMIPWRHFLICACHPCEKTDISPHSPMLFDSIRRWEIQRPKNGQ